MRIAHLVPVALALAVSPHAQEGSPRVLFLARIDHGVGGVLEFPDGTAREFHLDVASVQARLSDRRTPAGGGVLAIGSDAEKFILDGLEAWVAATFTVAERDELLALPRLPDPRNEEEDHALQRAQLLRTLRAYTEVTRPVITKVFLGRDTVSLSLQLRLGDRPPQQVLWRRFGDDAFARMHLDTDLEPVGIDSSTEGRILLGLGHWLAVQLVGFDRIWEGEHEPANRDVALVLEAFRGYLLATSPRLRSAGTVMDAGKTGSRMFVWTDAQNRRSTARFDYAAGTETPGRLRDGSGRDAKLVEFGSVRERELLETFDRVVMLRRRFGGDKADEDTSLRMLEEELGNYRARFRRAGPGK